MLSLNVRHLGRVDYQGAWRAMRDFTAHRGSGTPDELWLLEHPPVFTLGRAARRAHLRHPGDIPIIETDRGGQVTYHGPGQVVAYVLLDLQRLKLGVRSLVARLEQAVIDLLAEGGVEGRRRPGAPGVYVAGGKVAALGLRVRRGCTYHGLALNGDMDLSPFGRIDPCGYPGLEVTHLKALETGWDMVQVRHRLQAQIVSQLGYTPEAVHVLEDGPHFSHAHRRDR